MIIQDKCKKSGDIKYLLYRSIQSRDNLFYKGFFVTPDSSGNYMVAI